MTKRLLIRTLLAASVCCILPTLVLAQSTFGRYPPGSYNPNYPGGDDPNPWPLTLMLRAPSAMGINNQPVLEFYRAGTAGSNGNWGVKLCAADVVHFTALPSGSPAQIQIRNNSTVNDGVNGGRMKVTFHTSAGVEPPICVEPFGGITSPRDLSSLTKFEIEECHLDINFCCTGP